MSRRICWSLVLIIPLIIAYMVTPLILEDLLLYVLLLVIGSCNIILAMLLLGYVIAPLTRLLRCRNWRFSGFPLAFILVIPIVLNSNTSLTLILIMLLFILSVIVSRYCCCTNLFSALVHVVAVWTIWGILVAIALVLRGVLH